MTPPTSYLLKFITHARRGAGTTASVRVFRLAGSRGSSGPFPWMRDGFPTGSTISTSIQTPESLGRLTELEIGHDSIGEPGTGWLLTGITVSRTADENQAHTVPQESDADEEPLDEIAWFPHGQWLGESDAGDGDSGPTRVVLYRQPLQKTHNSFADPPPFLFRGPNGALRYQQSKENIQQAPPLKSIQSAAFAIPESSKLELGKRGKVTKHHGWAGEDAYFIANDQALFGVSDGVSQWTEEGVDAGLFARALVQGAAIDGTMESAARQASIQQAKGSATLTIVRVDLAKSQCHSKVLGDSRVVIVRDGKVVERSVEQEHSFGVPFQLSSAEGRDQPSECLTYEWDLKAGDFIVTGTDGLFDNVGEDEIARIVSSKSSRTCFDKAVALCQAAFVVSQQTRGETPYSRAANEALNLAFSGGKKDDISVIVALVN